MRVFPFLAALGCALHVCACPAYGASPEGANQEGAIQTAPLGASARLFAERTALLAGDAKCHVLAPAVRAALSATTAQERFAALQEGWSGDALSALTHRADAIGRMRGCADAALQQAARGAREGFAAWAKMPAMRFVGAERRWDAQRAPDEDGWILAQDLTGGAKFGLAANPSGQLMVVLALPPGSAPAEARVFLRDRARAPNAMLDIPGRAARMGLEGGVAPRAIETVRFASQRIVYAPPGGPARTLFVFSSSVLDEIAALDPRESVEIEIGSSQTGERLLVEVGNLAAAEAFLSAKPI